MKQYYLIVLGLTLNSLTFAQNVGIGTSTPNASAKLDVTSTNSGILIPRVALSATNVAAPVMAPVTSLMVYNTSTAGISPNNVTPGYYYWDGSQWTRIQNGAASNDWRITGNGTTNATTNFIGTTDGVDFVTRTNNIERMRVTTAGNVGIGTPTPGYRLDLATGTFAFGNANVRTETRDNAGLQGNAGAQSGFFETSIASPAVSGNYPAGSAGWWHLIDVRHSNNSNNYAMQIAGSFFDQDFWVRKTNNNAAQPWVKMLTTSNGWSTTGNSGTNAATNFIGTIDAVDFVTRTSNTERMRVTSVGNVGIGTPTPAANARLHVVGGAIMPQTGNNASAGIYFPPNPGGGGGDEAYIRHFVEAGENTKLVIANINDVDDDISFQTGLVGTERVQINGNGTVYLNRGVFFDCNDCGSAAAGSYNIADGGGANWGDLAIQGRVLSTNGNLHLSPPNGSRVVINSAYRAAGGATGTTGLDIEDGGIRMRKNYRWINRYGSTGGYGWGSQDWDLGNWDFCAVSHVGFRNTNSASDEDDDVQCAVYPSAHANSAESTTWDSYFTYQFNQRPNWRMYLEGFADTNATNCAAICMNFD